MSLLELLSALKTAPDPSSAELAWAWRGLSSHIDRRYRLRDREHDDVRQRTLLKVFGAVGRMEADTESRAEAWLRRVHRSAQADHHRNLGDKMMDRALRTTPADGDLGFVERVGPTVDPVESSRAASVDEEAVIDALLETCLGHVDGWLETHVKSLTKRHGDRRRAQVALLANVRGKGYDEIVTALGVDPSPSKSAVYKWVERGREGVLLPALAAWDHPAADALRELLEGARRADAGKARPKRRTAVSPRAKDPSSEGRNKT